MPARFHCSPSNPQNTLRSSCLKSRGIAHKKGCTLMPIKLDYAAMEAEAANLQSAAADFEASLSNLLNRINNLTSPEGGFSTEVSSGAFGTSYQEFNSKATQLIPSLQAFQQDLKNTIERFKAADGA